MPVGVDSPTNCTFGDPDQRTLYITTIGAPLSGPQYGATRMDHLATGALNQSTCGWYLVWQRRPAKNPPLPPFDKGGNRGDLPGVAADEIHFGDLTQPLDIDQAHTTISRSCIRQSRLCSKWSKREERPRRLGGTPVWPAPVDRRVPTTR